MRIIIKDASSDVSFFPPPIPFETPLRMKVLRMLFLQTGETANHKPPAASSLGKLFSSFALKRIGLPVLDSTGNWVLSQRWVSAHRTQGKPAPRCQQGQHNPLHLHLVNVVSAWSNGFWSLSRISRCASAKSVLISLWLLFLSLFRDRWSVCIMGNNLSSCVSCQAQDKVRVRSFRCHILLILLRL